MIEEVLRQLGAKVDSTSAIDYGTQYRVSKGADKAIVNVYRGKKGVRVVVQMNTPLAEELRAKLGASTSPVAKPPPGPTWAAWVGSDESGKGDYFGPLTVAAVGLTTATAAQAAAWGVRDCKTLSDGAALEMDRKIRAAFPYSVVEWMPEEYNRRYVGARSINRLLGEAHGEVLAGAVAKLPGAEAAVVDQFGDEAYVENALRGRGVSIRVLQRPKADETDLAVAAASVVARAAFIRGIEALGKAWGMSLHKGAGPEVVAGGRAFVKRHGLPALEKVAKLHFRTTQGL